MLCFPSGSKINDFAMQLWTIAVVFLIPAENLIKSHFLHPSSSWRRFIIFIQKYFLFSAHSSRRHKMAPKKMASLHLWLFTEKKVMVICF
jgi:hypothetical protein